jgi:hypothetical protein
MAAFRLSDECVASADGDLTDEDTADRYVYHRGVVTRLVNR